MKTDYTFKCSNLLDEMVKSHYDNGTPFQHIACLVQQCEKEGYEEPDYNWI